MKLGIGVWLRAVLAVAALAAWAPASRGAIDTQERWYALEMMGKPAGWMRTKQTEAKGEITSESEMSVSIKRGAAELTITMASEFVETASGKPVRMRSRQNMGGSPVDKTFEFKEDGIDLTTKQGDHVTKERLPLPEGSWLTPAGADRFVKQRRESGKTEITVRTIDPTSGIKPVTMTRSGFTPAKVKALGREIEVTKVAVTSSEMPGVTGYEYLDSEDVLVRSEGNLGTISLTMTLVKDKDEATRAGVADAPELMASTLVKPDRAIPNARHAKKAAFVLSVPEGEFPALPTTGSQTAKAQGKSAARVTIDTSFPNAAPAKEASDAAYLASTSMTDLKDEKIRELHDSAVKGEGESKARRAEAMRRYVFTYIKHKDFGVGYASASETARSRTGDCTEHGVLLAALLRADGIPARAAAGLVYADEFSGQKRIFGYHMWAQALLEEKGVKRWVDLDATPPRQTPYEATHIALAVSDLADGENAEGIAALAPLLGRLSISVESVE